MAATLSNLLLPVAALFTRDVTHPSFELLRLINGMAAIRFFSKFLALIGCWIPLNERHLINTATFAGICFCMFVLFFLMIFLKSVLSTHWCKLQSLMLRPYTLQLADVVRTLVSFDFKCKLLAVPGLFFVTPAIALLWLALWLLVERYHVGDAALRGDGAGGEQNEEYGDAANRWHALKARLLVFLLLATTRLAPNLKNLTSGLNDFWSIVLYAGAGVIVVSVLFLLFFSHANRQN